MIIFISHLCKVFNITKLKNTYSELLTFYKLDKLG